VSVRITTFLEAVIGTGSGYDVAPVRSMGNNPGKGLGG